MQSTPILFHSQVQKELIIIIKNFQRKGLEKYEGKQQSGVAQTNIIIIQKTEKSYLPELCEKEMDIFQWETVTTELDKYNCQSGSKRLSRQVIKFIN